MPARVRQMSLGDILGHRRPAVGRVIAGDQDLGAGSGTSPQGKPWAKETAMDVVAPFGLLHRADDVGAGASLVRHMLIMRRSRTVITDGRRRAGRRGRG